MSKIVSVEIISSGITSLMKSDEVVEFLEEKAEEIIPMCSGSYYTSTWIGENRANVSINTEDRKTYFKNLKDNELLKAIGGMKA